MIQILPRMQSARLDNNHMPAHAWNTFRKSSPWLLYIHPSDIQPIHMYNVSIQKRSLAPKEGFWITHGYSYWSWGSLLVKLIWQTIGWDSWPFKSAQIPQGYIRENDPRPIRTIFSLQISPFRWHRSIPNRYLLQAWPWRPPIPTIMSGAQSITEETDAI